MELSSSLSLSDLTLGVGLVCASSAHTCEVCLTGLGSQFCSPQNKCAGFWTPQPLSE